LIRSFFVENYYFLVHPRNYSNYGIKDYLNINGLKILSHVYI
jgi:hypothetical protein